MAITTYAELLTALDSWTARADLVSYTPDFIALTEHRLHYGMDAAQFRSPPLRVRAMEAASNLIVSAAQAGGTTTGSANAQASALSGFTLSVGAVVTFTVGSGLTNTDATTLNVNSTGAVSVVKAPGATALAAGDLLAGTGYVAYYNGTNWVLMPERGVPLPTDFLSLRRLYLDSDPKRSLDQLTPGDLAAKWASSQTGQPVSFAIEADTMVFGPRADTTYTGKILYWRKIPALTSTNTTNWLITNHPGVYLFGALFEAYRFSRDVDEAAAAFAQFSALVAGLQRANDGDRYGAGLLVARTDTGNP